MYMENPVVSPNPSAPIIETNAPAAMPPTVSPSSGRSPLLVVVALLLLLVVVGLVGVVIFLLKRPTPTAVLTTSSPTPAPAAPNQQWAVNTTNWLTYTDPVAGFSFKYPQTVLLNDESDNKSKIHLSVLVEKVADMPEDMPTPFLGRHDAVKEKAELTQGGTTAIKIGSLYARPSYTYSLFEECSVMFVRRLAFYPADYRAVLTLTAPEEPVMNAMPTFFTTNTTCPNRVWDHTKNSGFETALTQHQGQGIAQEWYDTFYAIADTVQVFPPTATPSPSPTPIPTPTPTPSPTPVSGISYTNEKYGFSLIYDQPYKLLVDKDNLYGYPHGVVLLYTGGQSYNLVIEAWDTKAAYESEYGPRVSDLTVFQNKGKYITVLDNTGSAANKKIIESIKILP
jgi:hypothetical protein